jgi:ribosomal protein S8
VAQARLFEKFCHLLARTVYIKELEAKNETAHCGRIKRNLKKINVSVIQTMMRGVRTKIRKIADNRPLALVAL